MVVSRRAKWALFFTLIPVFWFASRSIFRWPITQDQNNPILLWGLDEPIAGLAPLLGLILGFLALRDIKHHQGNLRGRYRALTSIWLCGYFLLAQLFTVAILVGRK